MRLAVIGTGVMGRNHARAIQSAGHTLVGVVDPQPDARDRVATERGVAGYASLQDLLDADKADAVVVATPTVTHGPIGQEALAAGLHVLVEKPIAHDLMTARTLIEAAARAGKVLAVGHIERHNPVVGFAKRALDDVRFGRPITISTRRVSRYPGRIRDVGCILDIGIHDIDVLNHLAGAAPESVYATGGRWSPEASVEDHANLLLSYPGGLHGSVEVNWLTPRKVRRLALTCEQAFVECDYMEQSVEISRSTYGNVNEGDLSQIPIETHVETVTLQREEPLMRELHDFVQAIDEGRAPLADGAVGFQAVAVAQAALESMDTGLPAAPPRLEEVTA